jgi:hypothetical protein
MNYLEKTILEILKSHRGSENPITAGELEKRTASSSRSIRKAIASLVTKHDLPVASSVHPPYGFYIVDDRDEALGCLRQYWARVREIASRARSLTRAVELKFGIKCQEEFRFDRETQPSA